MVETFLSSKCPLCAAVGFPHLQKKDAHRKNYKIHRCSQCTVWYIHPMPTSDTLNELYQNTYFKKRSDRGYADYTSEKIYTSVTQTLHKNLTDLNFFAWAKTRPQKRLLEVGCAAGHAVDYFVRRGWEAIGIDIAHEMVEAGRGLGRPLLDDNFLTHNFGEQQFDLITHWATLEHLPDAKKFLQKMASLLAPEGKIYLSTCNTGYFARRYANAWRYLNVPEHVFYFNKKSLTHLAHSVSLKINRAFSYGSGFTAIENSNLYYRLRKRFFDQMARFLLSGDMIVIELTHGASAPFAQ